MHVVEPVNRYTNGEYADEKESARALDDILDEIELFNVYREVKGEYDQPRLLQEEKSPRIDRILSPTPSLVREGWHHGPIGIELKRSGLKIGKVLAQAMDYSRAVWLLSNGFNIKIKYVFIWPLEKQHGDIASLMAQHRIGSAFHTRYTNLHLMTGEVNILRVDKDGTITIGTVECGRRAGSR